MNSSRQSALASLVVHVCVCVCEYQNQRSDVRTFLGRFCTDCLGVEEALVVRSGLELVQVQVRGPAGLDRKMCLQKSSQR